MPTLDPSLRDQLATVIGKESADGGARVIAEAGARASIEALAVHRAAPYAHLDAATRQLRNRLRARARQLGDARYADGRHAIGQLVEQAAYEHWHRMLFARFLAENALLIHPELGVAVTLGECDALAASEGAVDGWELAGRYASRMLPQIFRPDDVLLEVRFALDDVRKLEGLLESLPAELFRASDSLGWCYQFWQARKKKEVNKSGEKIGANELPAVTQLFTEPYMVRFLLHNTLGAWWVGAGRELPLEMPYLRRLEDGAPAAGTFEGWPRLAQELKVLDPCCGSGHFLVEAFLILVPFRVVEEGLSPREACDAVLRDNLFGLEIDTRCVQIAAFALALTAWTYPGAGGYRPLAPMNVACSGLAVSAKKEEWERLGGDNARLRSGMRRLWELFQSAPVLGSLIDPTRAPPDPMFTAGFNEIEHLLSKALNRERELANPDEHEKIVAAKGIVEAAELLRSHYSLVTTNVPYLTERKQAPKLRSYCEAHYAEGKKDLATALSLRSYRLSSPTGSVALVTPQNWLFLSSYKPFRRHTLRDRAIRLLARLGPGAFETITGEIVNVALCVVSAENDNRDSAVMLDASTMSTVDSKAECLMFGILSSFSWSAQLANPDSRIVLGETGSGPLLSEFVDSPQGIKTGDDGRFRRCFWEVSAIGTGWERYQSTVRTTVAFGGCSYVIDWRSGGDGMVRPRRECVAIGRQGVAVSQIGNFASCFYSGVRFDSNVAPLVPRDAALIPALWAYITSSDYRESVRLIDKKLNVTNATLTKVPFDVSRWAQAANLVLPDGLPAPHSEDPSQWLFSGQPHPSDAPLQVAVARLLGYRWPDQHPDTLDTHTDDDGIVCIPALRGERPAADRLTDLLAAAWGEGWHPQTLTDLLAAVGHRGSLEEWLRDAFFKQHCKLFHNRPFIWHIWDGHREGFSALVNYHKLDNDTLKSLTWTYLGDWIRTQEIEDSAGRSGAGDRLVKARILQQRLAAILEGEAPLDVFVRWKPIEEQPLGWRPDLDDGVRLNIRPFLTVADVGPKGAGVLRWKPNNKWSKDPGKNPPRSPRGEARGNDRHLTLAEKRAARGE